MVLPRVNRRSEVLTRETRTFLLALPVIRFWFEFRSKVLSSVIGSIASKAADAVCSHVDDTNPMNALIIGRIKEEYSSGF